MFFSVSEVVVGLSAVNLFVVVLLIALEVCAVLLAVPFFSSVMPVCVLIRLVHRRLDIVHWAQPMLMLWMNELSVKMYSSLEGSNVICFCCFSEELIVLVVWFLKVRSQATFGKVFVNGCEMALFNCVIPSRWSGAPRPCMSYLFWSAKLANYFTLLVC